MTRYIVQVSHPTLGQFEHVVRAASPEAAAGRVQLAHPSAQIGTVWEVAKRWEGRKG